MSMTVPMAAWRWSRRLPAVGLVLLAVAAAFLLSGAPAPAAQGSVQLIVQLQRSADVGQATEGLERLGAADVRSLPIINGLAASVPRNRVSEVVAIPGVRVVSRNAPVHESAYDIKADKLLTAWPASAHATNSWGGHFTGKGVGVAVVDSGIDGDLPDFDRSNTDHSSRVVASVTINPDATGAGDAYGHGTHIAGIIAGSGATRAGTDPYLNRYTGAAPEADLVDVKVGDDNGHTTVLDVILGLQFVLDHKASLNIRVVNLSLNSSTPQSYTTDPLDAAAEELWFHGVVVVAAAGNRGGDADAVSYAPGNDPYVITVGAVDDQGNKDTGNDVLATWSSHGTTQDGFAKPEVLAPGAHIVSTVGPNAAFRTICPSCDRGGDYFQVGGTSEATGVVSGAVADVLQKHPSWTPDMVKGAIIAKLRDVPGTGREIAIDGALGVADKDAAGRWIANQGLTPNSMIDPATGGVDLTRASWSRASWSDASDLLRASWSRASWSCACASREDQSATADPSRASWSRASWSRASWSSSFAK